MIKLLISNNSQFTVAIGELGSSKDLIELDNKSARTA